MDEVLEYQKELANMNLGKIIDRMLYIQSEISLGSKGKVKEIEEMKLELSKLEIIRRFGNK